MTLISLPYHQDVEDFADEFDRSIRRSLNKLYAAIAAGLVGAGLLVIAMV